MKARIVSFRRGLKRQNTRQIVLKVEGIDNREKTKTLIGKQVKWTSPGGKDIKGKISSGHGNSGNVRAIMERGIPGQALGKEVSVE